MLLNLIFHHFPVTPPEGIFHDNSEAFNAISEALDDNSEMFNDISELFIDNSDLFNDNS